MSLDLADLLDDVEHVMLDSLRFATDPDETSTFDTRLGDVFAAAERTERVVSMVKPNPDQLTEALLAYAELSEQGRDAARRKSVFVGGSVSDIEVAAAAGVRCIAYVDEAGARGRFEGAGAAVIVADMSELAEALNARWDSLWCTPEEGCGC